MYSLIALGYTLVYGIIKLINFAHGEFCMVGAYAGLGVYVYLGNSMSLWVVVPAVLLASGVAGAIIGAISERVAYRPIRNAGRLSALLTAIGVSLLLQHAATFIDNGNPQAYSGRMAEFVQTPVKVGSGGIKAVELAFIPAALLLAAGLWYVVQKTRFGKAMRAVSLDMPAARLMGINVDRVIGRTFMVGGFLGGIAGTLLGATKVVAPTMGFMPGLNAFVAAVVGGIGSIGGAMLGGFSIGIAQYMLVFAGVPTEYKDIASFAMLIAVLILRPQGILGRKEAEKV